MSVLAQLPAAATAEETAAACLDGLDALLVALGLLAGEGPALIEAARGAVDELAEEAARLARLLDEREEDEPMHEHTRGRPLGAGGSP